MKMTAKKLREALHLLDDDEIIYIEQAPNLIHNIKGVFNYNSIPDIIGIAEPGKKHKREYEVKEAKYLNAFQARWVEKLNSDGTVSEKEIFVIEANQ